MQWDPMFYVDIGVLIVPGILWSSFRLVTVRPPIFSGGFTTWPATVVRIVEIPGRKASDGIQDSKPLKAGAGRPDPHLIRIFNPNRIGSFNPIRVARNEATLGLCRRGAPTKGVASARGTVRPCPTPSG
jgi:hypothetical protein